MARTSKAEIEDDRAAARLRRQAVFWLLAFAFFIGFLYIFRSILLPFVAGMALAYFLDPVADRLERLGFSRLWATVVIVFGFLVAFVLLLMILVPVLASQLADFISRLPEYFGRLQGLIAGFNPQFVSERLGFDITSLQESLNAVLRPYSEGPLPGEPEEGAMAQTAILQRAVELTAPPSITTLVSVRPLSSTMMGVLVDDRPILARAPDTSWPVMLSR